MPRFYIHLLSDDLDAHDEEGMDLPDMAAAREEACRSAREVVAFEIKGGKDVVTFCLHVDDETGAKIMEIPIVATVAGLERN